MARIPSLAGGAAWRPLLCLLLAGALLAGCFGGGGGSADAPPAAGSTVSGTAAVGAALAGVVVTLKDSANRSATATTSATGAFSLDTSGMTPPFLLQLTTPAGTRLLSVSTSDQRTATVNLTPLTDLVVRSWYLVQGQSADSAFANPVALPPPTPAQVRSIARILLPLLQLGIGASGAPVGEPEDLISKPFAADGTGIDRLLDIADVAMGPSGAVLTVVAGGVTQTSDLGYRTADNAITADTTSTNGTVTTTATSTSVVPVQGGQVQAIDAINAAMAGFSAAVNGRGTALVAADLEPFFAADLLDEGLNRSQFLAGLLPELRQLQNVSVLVDQVLALDATAGTARARVRFTASAGGQTSTEREEFFFRRGSDGTWRFFGDGRIAQVSVQAEGRRNQGLFSGGNGPSVNIDVRPVVGTVPASAGAMSVSAAFASPTVQLGSIEVLDSGLQLQPFFANTGVLSAPLPAAGTPVTITLLPTAGGSVSYTVPLNAFTTELVQITSPTGTTIAPGTHTVTWTLPVTYAVESIQLSVLTFTETSGSSAGFQCIADAPVVAATATSGQITIAPDCNGQPVRTANINLSTNGFNGERSQVIYGLNVVAP